VCPEFLASSEPVVGNVIVRLTVVMEVRHNFDRRFKCQSTLTMDSGAQK
jgi:hypothetical protein